MSGPSFISSIFSSIRAEATPYCIIGSTRLMLGQENWQPRRIASVRTTDGQRITVGLRDQSEPGTRIELFEDVGAPFGEGKK